MDADTTFTSAELVDSAICQGLEILADNVPGENEASDDAAKVRTLVDDIGVIRLLKALRDAADVAKDAALGGEHGGDLFDGVTDDDLCRVRYAIDRAIEAVS
jgi:hypothetical protein